jgi:hypothetical protein
VLASGIMLTQEAIEREMTAIGKELGLRAVAMEDMKELEVAKGSSLRATLLKTGFFLLLPTKVYTAVNQHYVEFRFTREHCGWYGETAINNVVLNDCIVKWCAKGARAARRKKGGPNYDAVMKEMMSVLVCLTKDDYGPLIYQELWCGC